MLNAERNASDGDGVQQAREPLAEAHQEAARATNTCWVRGVPAERAPPSFNETGIFRYYPELDA